MPKPNYQHLKKQREAAKKARQQEKLERKLARATEPAGVTADESPAAPAAPAAPTPDDTRS